jgi:tetratricopeptide (TPR) repeat protein
MAHSQLPATPTQRKSLAVRLGGLLPAWARGRFAAIGLAVGAIAFIGCTLGLALLFRGESGTKREFLPAKALSRLDGGELAEAREVANQLRALPGSTFSERGAAMYVLGSIAMREATEHPSQSQQRILFLVASRYLEEARIHGFPEGREADGLLQLGRAFHHSGRYAQSIPALREALQKKPALAGELHHLLAEGYFQLVPPKLNEALQHVHRLQETADLPAEDWQAGLLLEARILLARGDMSAAAAALGKLPPESALVAEAAMIQAHAAIQSAKQMLAKQPELDAEMRQAIADVLASLQALEKQRGIDREQLPSIALLVGQCHEILGDRPAAMSQYDRLRRSRFGRPEGLAATLQLADLVRRDARADAALELYQRTLQQAGPRAAYQNPWLPLAELESRLAAAAADFVATGNHAAAVELARDMPPLVAESVALEQQIAAHTGWAKQLLVQADSQPAAQAELLRAEARQHYRQAGSDGERLAAMRLATRFYVDDLVSAAEHFRFGQGYVQAARVYREFLRQNPPQRVPEALVGLGESLLALGELDSAIAVLARCRDDFPAHPATYRARVLESQAWQEKGDLARAKSLLLDNLYRHALTPKSTDWRDSLYALGRLHYREGCELETKSRTSGVDQLDEDVKKEGLKLLEQGFAAFQDSIRTLTEAVERYPAAAQALEARYWIAEAYRHAALWPRKKLAVTNIETSRLALNRQIQQELDAAVNQYQSLLTELSDEQLLPRRTSVELAMLRNCYFGKADSLYDLGRYDEAIRAYSDATNRYQHDPESLEAYVQIANCYRRLKRPNEARGTLEQARVVLQRIRPDADFIRTTRLDRQEWSNLLDWLRTL